MQFFLCFLFVFLGSITYNTTQLNIFDFVDRSPSMNLQNFKIQVLTENNRLRPLYDIPPLTLTEELDDLATDWAEKLTERYSVREQLNADKGENIFVTTGPDVHGGTAVKNGYNEFTDYDSENGIVDVSNFGDFSQFIWKNTRELGIGAVKNGNSVWVVANYSPPGNNEGQFQENVQPI